MVQTLSTIGGGSLPGETLPSSAVSIGADGLNERAESLVGRMRRGDPPVVGRIEDEHVLLDPRTVLPEEDERLLNVIGAVLG